MIGLLVIAIVALSRRAHDNLQGRRRSARRRSQQASDLMQETLGANWGPHLYPLEWFATHSVCASCDRVFSTVDRDDECRVADSGCHTFSASLHELIRYAVERKYRAAPPPISLPSAAVADRANADAVLVVHAPALESAWVLIDRDAEAEQLSPALQVAPPPPLPAEPLPVGNLIGAPDETPGEPFVVPDDAVLPPPSPDDQQPLSDSNFPPVPASEPALDFLPPVPQLEPQFADVQSLPPQYLLS
jgi:hypothetical protein